MQLRYQGVAYDRTLALITGEVRPEGLELEYTVDLPIPIFQRMFDTDEFDASELSLSNYIMLRARGDERFVGLPMFPSRAFRHDTVYVHADAGIERPEDLRGRRVGIPEYQQTANFWVRAFLQHDHGVAPEAIHWVRERREKVALELPGHLSIVDAPAGRTLSDLLDAGEIDAMIGPSKPACFTAGSPRVRRLFPDFAAVEADYFRRTGHFPIMHLVVLRRRVHERDRSIARRLFDAFEASKLHALERLERSTFLATSLPLQIANAEEARTIFGPDPFPNGVARTRHTVSALSRYIVEQGLATREVAMEELFAAELLDT